MNAVLLEKQMSSTLDPRWWGKSMSNSASVRHVPWDCAEHAPHYDKRADYSPNAIWNLLTPMGCSPGRTVAEIGAGAGKFTKELVKHRLLVRSVEPNDAMRPIGIQDTQCELVTWSISKGETTKLHTSSVYAVFFGSSFNVVDQDLALTEVSRILVSHGWFAAC
jgi:ubiquinone/menaquinone biosynthesis C-methylase UbiE